MERPGPPVNDFDEMLLLAAEGVAKQWDKGNVDTELWSAALGLLTHAYFLRANHKGEE